ncbi:hypothetical protein M8494_08925 [Serratia ureilytica]
MAGALASGASPYLATEIKKLTTNPLTGEVDVAANTMAHAVLGAVTAQLNNQSAAAGLGAGAVNWRRATLPGSCSRQDGAAAERK